jgi:hypothetical protein
MKAACGTGLHQLAGTLLSFANSYSIVNIHRPCHRNIISHQTVASGSIILIISSPPWLALQHFRRQFTHRM